MRALTLALTLVAAPAWATCPGYLASTSGWKHGSQVTYNVSQVPEFYRQAAIDAFKNWSAANAVNGSGISFIESAPGVSANMLVSVDAIPDKNGAPVGGNTGLINAGGSDILARAITVINSPKFEPIGDRQGFFTKLLMHEIGHTMGLNHVDSQCGNAGATVMNNACGFDNDSKGILPTDAQQPCDVNAVRNDTRQPPPAPPIKPPGPIVRGPDPGCGPGGGPPMCYIRRACTYYSDGTPRDCLDEKICEGGGAGGPYYRLSCSGMRSQVTISGPVCGDWLEISNSPTLPGDYACQNIFDPAFQVPTCEQLALRSTVQGCSGELTWTVDDLGLRCYMCPAVTPPLPPDPGPGPCTPASCGYSTGQQCRWLPDGCGGQHLCGTCGPTCVPGTDLDGNPFMYCGDEPGPAPSCSGAHNEVCYPSFKACADECCGVCQRKIGCGGESAHKCFEP